MLTGSLASSIHGVPRATNARVDLDGFPLVIATPEDVVLAKLEWHKMGDSERQLADVAGIIRAQGEKLDIPYIEHWVDALGLENEWPAARAMEKK